MQAAGDVTLRSRLGGRRAVSWQAAVIGDVLIVILATMLAAAESGERRSVDAATDVFAITMATAVVAAVYMAIAHRTFLRHRSVNPVPVPAAVAFHLSVGVIFLVGFAVGSVILGIPQFGGSLRFSIGVLLGGLAVCLPTSLLLDHADRYQHDREQLLTRLVDLELLRISEWSLRQALRKLASRVVDQRVAGDLEERFVVLQESADPVLGADRWWQVSMTHHGAAGARVPAGVGAGALQRAASVDFRQLIEQEMSREFPVVRWRTQARHALSVPPTLPSLAALASMVTVGILMSLIIPSELAFAIAGSAAIVILLTQVAAARLLPLLHVAPGIRLAVTVILSGVVALTWVMLSSTAGIVASLALAAMAALTVLGTLLAFAWVNAVLIARRDQVDELAEEADRRVEESEAVMSSLSAIVSRMSRVEPLSGSAAIAACAAGLQRARRGLAPSAARRILDWTESVVSASVVPDSSSLATRIEQTVHPWRALADIAVEFDDWDPREGGPSDEAVEDVLRHVDRVVQDSCRIEQAEAISIAVHGSASSGLTVDVELDGVPAPHFSFSTA